MADKLLQVREHLLEKIESGDIRGGDKLPGARELAEQLGVSLALMQTAARSADPATAQKQSDSCGFAATTDLSENQTAGTCIFRTRFLLPVLIWFLPAESW